MKKLMNINLAILIFSLIGISKAYAIKSVQFSSVSAVSVLSIEGTRLKNPQIYVVGKNLKGKYLSLLFTYNTETAKSCLALANEAVSSKKKMVINVNDKPNNDEYGVLGCATGNEPLPIPIF